MDTTTATTIDTFRKACDGLAEAVNRKLFEGSRSFYWIGDEAGGLCDFDDCDIIKPEDMVRILESGMTYDEYAAWRDANTDNTQYINLASWLKGLRHGMIDSQPREPLAERISEEARAEADVAFVLGAETAKREFLKSLWHDASEEPDFESKRSLVCVYGETEDYAEGEIHSGIGLYDYIKQDWEYHFHTRNGLKDYKFDWKQYAKDRSILKWGYADELLVDDWFSERGDKR